MEEIPPEILLEMYRKMLLIRRFEERAIELYSKQSLMQVFTIISPAFIPNPKS